MIPLPGVFFCIGNSSFPIQIKTLRYGCAPRGEEVNAMHSARARKSRKQLFVLNEQCIQVKNLTKSFSGRKVINDLSFEVKKDEGKATILGMDATGNWD